MRRSNAPIHVAVDTNIVSDSCSLKSQSIPLATDTHSTTYNPPSPSLHLLFSLLTRRDVFILLIPAIFASLAASAVPPAMTQVIGIAFDAFSAFPASPTQRDRDQLLQGVGFAAILLVALAGASLVLSSLMSSSWIWLGERNARRLRMLVYDAVTSREMEWFDLKLGAEDKNPVAESTQGESGGAGGLMAKFSTDTDEVRMATSLNMGIMIQFGSTLIVSLVLALRRSWSLTLIILCSIPLMIIIQGLSQGLSMGFYDLQRSKISQAATLIDRAIASITTVKAFNAASREQAAADRAIEEARLSGNKLALVWGLSSGISHFISLAMFVQGFWYGSKLVRDGSITPGDVMAVFWACLIAASTLQLLIPLILVYTKGKSAMASLMALINAPAHTSRPSTPQSPVFHSIDPLAPHSKSRSPKRSPPIPPQSNLTKVCPRKCFGEFQLRNIYFSYPSRPTLPVLSDLSLYLPAGEMTFIVGGSGSGKSTIAQLLVRLYEPQFGTIDLDDQTFRHLDREWCKKHIAAVSQGCILFDMSVHDNVAIGLAGSESGRTPESATREEVINACRVSLMHDFIKELPDGYDTKLGNGGANLSGGQRQRLAIARAIMRNPTVLILDEATSALDATSRLLVFEAVRTWRRNRTTIVITHDLSQIAPNDFLYMLKDGHVIEQGYRVDLEAYQNGTFRSLMDRQREDGGFEVKNNPESYISSNRATREIDAILEKVDETAKAFKIKARRQSLHVTPHSSGLWMIDAVADLTRARDRKSIMASRLPSLMPPPPPVPALFTFRRRSSIDVSPPPSAAKQYFNTRSSLQFVPSSPSLPSMYSTMSGRSMPEQPAIPSMRPVIELVVEEDETFEMEKAAVNMSGNEARRGRMNQGVQRMRWDHAHLGPATAASRARRLQKHSATTSSEKQEPVQTIYNDDPQVSLIRLIRNFYPTVPSKITTAIGLFFALLSGASTPIFAYLLSLLLIEVTTGAQRVDLITFYATLVLVIAASDGISAGLKFFFLEISANAWVASLRSRSFAKILRQDKTFFDHPSNSSERIVQVLIQDGADARSLISSVIGQFVVVIAMLGVGLVWALVTGWQLTLAGIAIAPVFAITMTLQAGFVAKFETTNKRAREEVAKKYYDAVANIRAIRSMGLEGIFRKNFATTLGEALRSGVRGAFVEGCSFGIANSLIYLAEALLFYLGALFMSRGIYTYSQMIQALNLVVFTVCIASQLMTFVQRINKAVQATHDFGKVLALENETTETRGTLRYRIRGDVSFKNVTFTYPQRPDVPVLKDVSFQLTSGECVAIVGSSGSGKSTIAALLQRFYEPDNGDIMIGNNRLRDSDVVWLREHVGIVSQHAQLFDTSIRDNIGYGSSLIPFGEIERAAKEANVHDFIMSLPKGYETLVGENGSLISGGQAQRIQIARSLVRTANILILDECTSALDLTNQAAVMKTIMKVKRGRTTIVVTHKLPLMKMCERIIVLDQGVVKEQGTYDTLMQRRGHFFQLANAGEWSKE